MGVHGMPALAAEGGPERWWCKGLLPRAERQLVPDCPCQWKERQPEVWIYIDSWAGTYGLADQSATWKERDWKTGDKEAGSYATGPLKIGSV